jgi:maleylacetoacetate isomerase
MSSPTPQSPVILYHYFRSSSSWRVRWALYLKDIAFTGVAIDLLKGQQHQADYEAKNPLGFVPALTIAGHNLAESVAILEYLEETHPTPALLPGDALGRARVRQLVQVISADTQPLQNLSVLRHVGRLNASPDAQKEWARHYIERGLTAYETLLHEAGWPSGVYSYGDEVSMAELCLVPQCYNARRQGLDLSRWPRIAAIEAAALATPAAQKSHPDAAQPEG